MSCTQNEFILRPLMPSDAEDALAVFNQSCLAGEVLYKPLGKDDFLARFFEKGRMGFAAETNGRLIGWAHAAAKTRFLDGETDANTPLYLTLIVVDPRYRKMGVGRMLIEAVRQAGRDAGKTTVAVTDRNPVHLTWLIPGANGHDHNNAPGVWEDGEGYAFLRHMGFGGGYHEISMYLNLRDYRPDAHLSQRIAALNDEGIYAGPWRPDFGCEYDLMCDRVGSEYWRNVLRTELAAWREDRPNDDPECWADGIPPKGPRTILTAVKDGHIIGFTGPVDLQASGRGWFTGICVDPSYGGRGIGTVLFNLLMQAFIAEGAAFCSLFTGSDNHAQKIYARAGLRVTSKWCAMSMPVKA